MEAELGDVEASLEVWAAAPERQALLAEQEALRDRLRRAQEATGKGNGEAFL